MGVDHVETAVGHVEVVDVARLEPQVHLSAGLGQPAGLLEDAGGGVDAEHRALGDPSGQTDRDRPRAAADIEHPGVGAHSRQEVGGGVLDAALAMRPQHGVVVPVEVALGGPTRHPVSSSRRTSGRARGRNKGDGEGVVPGMTTIGIIGSGNIGGTVAALAVAAGHEVILSNSRGPETLRDLADGLGPRARAGTTEEAASGELVLVSVPLTAYGAIAALPLAGKVVMDTGNYYPGRDGVLPDLEAKTVTDTGYLARQLPGASVVKVFNNIFYKHLEHLARPAGAADRSALPIAGDDDAAKAAVVAFVDSIGYDAVDAGPLSESWRLQSGSPAYGAPYGPFADEQGTPADASAIRSALAEATR